MVANDAKITMLARRRGTGKGGRGRKIEPSSKSPGFSYIVRPSSTDSTTNSGCLKIHVKLSRFG